MAVLKNELVREMSGVRRVQGGGLFKHTKPSNTLLCLENSACRVKFDGLYVANRSWRIENSRFIPGVSRASQDNFVARSQNPSTKMLSRLSAGAFRKAAGNGCTSAYARSGFASVRTTGNCAIQHIYRDVTGRSEMPQLVPPLRQLLRCVLYHMLDVTGR